MTMEAQRVLPRDLDSVREALADSGRVERAKSDHMEGLRKLATAAQVAAGRGATRDEVLAVVALALAETVGEGEGPARGAARLRAMVHDGDDTF